jgi:DNA-binding XRE family transcriptional regulator
MRLTTPPVVTLAQARTRRAFSQHELALAAGVSRATITRCERGLSVPLARVRRQLAEALRCDPAVIQWPSRAQEVS